MAPGEITPAWVRSVSVGGRASASGGELCGGLSSLPPPCGPRIGVGGFFRSCKPQTLTASLSAPPSSKLGAIAEPSHSIPRALPGPGLLAAGSGPASPYGTAKPTNPDF